VAVNESGWLSQKKGRSGMTKLLWNALILAWLLSIGVLSCFACICFMPDEGSPHIHAGIACSALLFCDAVLFVTWIGSIIDKIDDWGID
jgi:hypothetical protein